MATESFIDYPDFPPLPEKGAGQSDPEYMATLHKWSRTKIDLFDDWSNNVWLTVKAEGAADLVALDGLLHLHVDSGRTCESRSSSSRSLTAASTFDLNAFRRELAEVLRQAK